MIASPEGGVNIEEVAEKNPDAIFKFPIDINEGLTKAAAMEAVKTLGFPEDRHDEVAQVLLNLYKMFQEKDATMVEINPFAEDSNGACRIICCLFIATLSNVYSCFQIFASTPRSVSTTTPSSVRKPCLTSATGVRRTNPRWRPLTTTSTILRLTATLAAW
jgi:hypothetical protein